MARKRRKSILGTRGFVKPPAFKLSKWETRWF